MKKIIGIHLQKKKKLTIGNGDFTIKAWGASSSKHDDQGLNLLPRKWGGSVNRTCEVSVKNVVHFGIFREWITSNYLDMKGDKYLVSILCAAHRTAASHGVFEWF